MNSFGLGMSWIPNKADDIFPDPFADYASTVMPEHMTHALRWCFPAGTLIELDGLQYKPIEQVIAGDHVLTRGGTSERVVRTSVREAPGPLTLVEVAGFGKSLPLRLTGNHPLPVFRVEKGTSPWEVEAIKVAAKDLRPGDFVAARLPLLTSTLTPRFSGWLLGLYVAKGCGVYDRNRSLIGVRFTCKAEDEQNGVLEKLTTELRYAVSQKAKVSTPPSQPDVRLITVHDPELPDWLVAHGGALAEARVVSPEVLCYGKEFVTDFIAGWLDGDGHCEPGAATVGTTASPVLARQLQRLGFLAGFLPSLTKIGSSENTTCEATDGVVYTVRFQTHDSYLLRLASCKASAAWRHFGIHRVGSGRRPEFLRHEDTIYFRVLSVTPDSVAAGLVYNFEVENDHSYLADGIHAFNCEYIMNNNGTYKAAVLRVLSYFITDVDVGDEETGDDEKSKYVEFLNDTLDIKRVLFDVGQDFMTYGNTFSSLLIPFRRYLYCPRCYAEHPLRVVATYKDFDFKWSNFQFHAKCQNRDLDGKPCGYCGPWKHIDRRDTDETQIRVKLWSPHEIDIKEDELTKNCSYIWKIPDYYRQKVRQGYLHYLETCHWEIIECIKHNKNLEFAPDFIYHLKETPLSGHRTGGWGISRILANFRQAWYVQVLHRFNEAIAMDYVIPFRVITPAPGRSPNAESADPILNMDMGGFMGHVQNMIRRRRRHPAEWHTLPYPVQYQALGGEAKQLAPFELLDQGISVLLNNVGVPTEMYKGTLQLQAAPPALRLFESTWTYLVHGLNCFLRKLIRQIAEALGWEPVKAKLTRVNVVDDLQDQMNRLQLMMGRQISQTTGLKGVGLDFREEQRRILEEERYVQEQQARLQEEMDQAASMEQMAPPTQPGQAQMPGQGDPNAQAQGGGGPAQSAAQGIQAAMPTQPNQKITPQDMLQKAQTVAEQLMAMSDSQRQSEMTKLKQSDQALHAIVKQVIDDMRQQAQTAGGAQLLAQQFGQQR